MFFSFGFDLPFLFFEPSDLFIVRSHVNLVLYKLRLKATFSVSDDCKVNTYIRVKVHGEDIGTDCDSPP